LAAGDTNLQRYVHNSPVNAAGQRGWKEKEWQPDIHDDKPIDNFPKDALCGNVDTRSVPVSAPRRSPMDETSDAHNA
jgi:hypothetical protein